MAAIEQHHVAAPRSARLYERHYRRVLSYCLWRLGNHEDAEDAAQSTFLNAHHALTRGTVPGSEAAWLLAIAANVCRARWRSRQSRPCEITHAPADLATFAAPEHDQELLAALRSALDGLPKQQRAAYALREWRGLSYADIAEQLHTSESAVASLVFRARESLADALRDERPSRRRLGANLGSIAAWAKTLVGGTAAKVAVAGAVAGVATVAAVVPLERGHDRGVSAPTPRAARATALTTREAAGVHPEDSRVLVAPARGQQTASRSANVSRRRPPVSWRHAAARGGAPAGEISAPTPPPAAPTPSPEPVPKSSPTTAPAVAPPGPPVVPAPSLPPAGKIVDGTAGTVTQVGDTVTQVAGTVSQATSQLAAAPLVPKLAP